MAVTGKRESGIGQSKNKSTMANLVSIQMHGRYTHLHACLTWFAKNQFHAHGLP
jgi:hypothetical protein